MAKVTIRDVGNELRVSITNTTKTNHVGRTKGKPMSERSSQSISRSKRLIREIVQCNNFTYFATFEISPTHVKKHSSESCHEEIKQYLQELCRKHPGLAFLMIPEPYKDRRKMLHAHALLQNVPTEALIAWRDKKGRKPRKVRELLKAGEEVYTLKDYETNYGYCLITVAHDAENRSRYMMKNLNDASDFRKAGHRLFYTGGPLKRPKLLAKGNIAYVDEKKLGAQAKSCYPHRSDKEGPIYGMTYNVDNNERAKQEILRLITPNPW